MFLSGITGDAQLGVAEESGQLNAHQAAFSSSVFVAYSNVYRFWSSSLNA